MSGDESASEPGTPRSLSLWLIAAIVTAPAFFFWLLLRRGYSFEVRLGAFLFMLFTIVVAIVRLSTPH